MCEIADVVHAHAVPRLRDPAVAEVGERGSGVGVGPAIGGADAAWTGSPRCGDAAEPPDIRRVAAHVRTDAAVHGHAEVLVDAVAGMVAGDVVYRPRREDPDTVQRAAVCHHLVERGHGAGGRISSAARNAGALSRRRIAVLEDYRLAGFRRGLVDVGGAAVLAVGQADIELSTQPERLDHGFADVIAKIPAGDALDQHRRGPVRSGAVIMDARS